MTEPPVWWDGFWFPEATHVIPLPLGHRRGRETLNGTPWASSHSTWCAHQATSARRGGVIPGKRSPGRKTENFHWANQKHNKTKPKWKQQSQGTLCSITFKVKACLKIKKLRDHKAIFLRDTEVWRRRVNKCQHNPAVRLGCFMMIQTIIIMVELLKKIEKEEESNNYTNQLKNPGRSPWTVCLHPSILLTAHLPLILRRSCVPTNSETGACLTTNGAFDGQHFSF